MRPPRHHAYVFYATNDTYAVAVLVFVQSLKRLGIRDDTDIVVFHLHLSRYLIAKFHEMGVRTRLVPALRYGLPRYYRDCLTKLRIFELDEYERVVYVDADAIPLKSLDPLFDLQFAEPVAAPSAYWLPEQLSGSHLLVVKPSGQLWTRIRRHFPHAMEKRYYDMDIVNLEFGDAIHTLPADIICLNSEWEDVCRPSFFDDPDDACTKVHVVHFTALGKPWSYSPKRARRLRPRAHPFFHELWERWWQTREELFATSTPWVRIRFAVAKWFCLGGALRRGTGDIVRRVLRANPADT